MANLKAVPAPTLVTRAQKTTRTKLDTILITPDLIRGWKSPPFQRPLTVNNKVKELAGRIAEEGGVIPGVLTLGAVGKEVYLLDGQHRREAFLISEATEGYADVRYHFFDNIADMGEEFVNVNTALVRLRPDDILRGLESSSVALTALRKACPFVGYDNIRRGTHSPILSMSAAIRCWKSSSAEVPGSGAAAGSAQHIASTLTEDDAEACALFLNLCNRAWGRDLEYAHLWRNLNLTLSAWLYRRLVITPWSPRTPKLTRELYSKAMQSLSADTAYLEWLVGRQLSERDRSPAFNRIKKIIAKRLEMELGKKILLPQPAWVAH